LTTLRQYLYYGHHIKKEDNSVKDENSPSGRTRQLEQDYFISSYGSTANRSGGAIILLGVKETLKNFMSKAKKDARGKRGRLKRRGA